MDGRTNTLTSIRLIIQEFGVYNAKKCDVLLYSAVISLFQLENNLGYKFEITGDNKNKYILCKNLSNDLKDMYSMNRKTKLANFVQKTVNVNVKKDIKRWRTLFSLCEQYGVNKRTWIISLFIYKELCIKNIDNEQSTLDFMAKYYPGAFINFDIAKRHLDEHIERII